MLVSFFLILLSLFGVFCSPIKQLRQLTFPLHQLCLNFAPNSIFKSDYQALVCAANSYSQKKLLQSSGLIHLFIIFGLQIFFIQLASKKIFSKYCYQNYFNFTFVFFLLSLTAFHPTSLRLAIALFLRELSRQRKLFWSPLQIAIFSGFSSLALEPELWQSISLLLGLSAALGFGFFYRSSNFKKLIFVYIFTFPVMMGLPNAHPLLSLGFFCLSRPILLVLFPLATLSFFNFTAEFIIDCFWQKLYNLAEILRAHFLIFENSANFSITEMWVYLIFLMSLLLHLENKTARNL